jgi:hypothetical protein
MAIEQDPVLIARLARLEERVGQLSTVVPLIPLSTAPQGATRGWVAYSDGTGSGFDASSGEGVYRYSGSAWVFLG